MNVDLTKKEIEALLSRATGSGITHIKTQYGPTTLQSAIAKLRKVVDDET